MPRFIRVIPKNKLAKLGIKPDKGKGDVSSNLAVRRGIKLKSHPPKLPSKIQARLAALKKLRQLRAKKLAAANRRATAIADLKASKKRQ